MSTAAEMVGPFELGRCLGRGGFAVVYEARHRQTHQRVAVKILHGTKEMEAEVQRRFIREIVVLKKLEHPNIVRVYEAGLHEGSIYCAMELVECGTLKDVLTARYRLPWLEAAEVLVQVCRALDHAHQRGCIHRDLKPANLYLSESGLVKLGDLGLVRDLNDSRLTVAGQTVGTWRYMAPEQIMGADLIDGRLDIYALGCIAFEMVTGHVPFDGPDFTVIFDQHLESAPARLDVATRDCPREFADIVEQMLAKNPDDRPASAGVVAERLEMLIGGIPAAASMDREAVAMPDAPVQSAPNLTRRLHGGSVASRSRTRWPVMAIILAAAIGAGLWLAMR